MHWDLQSAETNSVLWEMMTYWNGWLAQKIFWTWNTTNYGAGPIPDRYGKTT
jgi:hypothetical protein